MMQTIYKPKGKAGEYAELALNLYTGCSHGCTYCYAPRMLHMSREEFMKPKPREGIIEALKKDIKKYKDKEIFLCFTCDPYQPIESFYQLTRQAIKIIKVHGNKVRVLTKSHLAERDFYLLNSNDYFGVTLTFSLRYDFEGRKYEPQASSPSYRMASLLRAKDEHINTWVSLEPVIDTAQTLQIIKETHHYVDEYKCGRWNYDKRANDIDWHKFVNEEIELLEKYNKKYYIKEDLRKYI